MVPHSDSTGIDGFDGQLWMARDGQNFLGHGRIALLEKIMETGSISAAARAIGMSYKAAWQAIDTMNNLSEAPLVSRSVGGKHGGGTQVTEHGKRIVNLYRVVELEYRRFLGGLSAGLSDFLHFYELMQRFALNTSVRNQLPAVVTAIDVGSVNSEVRLKLSGGDELVSIIPNEACESLQLACDSDVVALFQESSVFLSPELDLRSSARNRLTGKVVRCVEGAVNAEVALSLAGGIAISAVITQKSLERMGVREGMEMVAFIKASDVMLATAS